jgi:hypothetical protein
MAPKPKTRAETIDGYFAVSPSKGTNPLSPGQAVALVRNLVKARIAENAD